MNDTDIYRGPFAGWLAVSATPGRSMKLAGLLPFLCFTLIFGANAFAQTPSINEVVQLLADDGMLDDRFGVSVALDGDTVLIGARLADYNAADTGAAYVFTRDENGMWSQQQKLTAIDGEAGDDFGESVALVGNTAVIGARQNDDGAGDDSGSAYVFTRDGSGMWSQQQKLTAGVGAADDEFGTSVAFDGTTILIGAPGDDGAEMGGDDRGAVYLFILEDDGMEGTTWTEQQKLTAGDGANDDEFGISVALDGDTAVIGAEKGDGTETDSGAAYVFILENDGEGGITWTEQQKLTASDGVEDDRFGESVALDGITIMIGATRDDDAGNASGSVYVFIQGEGWDEQQKLTASDGTPDDGFGASVAVYGDVAAIGAPVAAAGNVGDAGAAYVFARDGGGTWIEEFKLIASNAASDDELGNTGAVAIVGSTVIAGADQPTQMLGDVGAAYVFNVVFDTDGDGIRDDVDTSPFVASDDFDDGPNGGITTGTITNRGDHDEVRIEDSPYGPPDDGVLVTFSGSVSGNVPAIVKACVNAVSESSKVFATITVTCGSVIVEVISGGPAEFTFTADDGTESTTVLESGDAVEFDNVLGTFEVNNAVEVTIDGTPFILEPGPAARPVTVVIKPGSDYACINPRSKGVTTVALLGSSFLDVSYLDAASLAFGADSDPATAGVTPMRGKYHADVNGDSYPDAVLQVKTSVLDDAGLLQDGAPLYVTGYLPDGTLVRGFDKVWLAGGPNCN